MCNIRMMTVDDWPSVLQIYEQGIASNLATFETTLPSWEVWNQNHLAFGRLVLTQADEVLGWAALSKVSARKVYEGVAEVSVYIATSHQGQGFGQSLLGALVHQSEINGIWSLQASVFPENRASLEIHRRCEFREVGRRERIGQLHGVWRDTLLLERRSNSVGTN